MLDMDYAKVFDKVAYERLLVKMEGHGIARHTLNLAPDFLRKRYQKVAINGSSQPGQR